MTRQAHQARGVAGAPPARSCFGSSEALDYVEVFSLTHLSPQGRPGREPRRPHDTRLFHRLVPRSKILSVIDAFTTSELDEIEQAYYAFEFYSDLMTVLEMEAFHHLLSLVDFTFGLTGPEHQRKEGRSDNPAVLFLACDGWETFELKKENGFSKTIASNWC